MSTTPPFPPVPRAPGPTDRRDEELDDAVARLRAARADGEGGGPRRAAPVPPGAGDDELARRLRARRSAGHVAAAYSAAHGHPLGPDGAADADDGAGGRRWTIGSRAAVVAATAVLVLALGAGLVALRSGGAAVEPLAPLGGSAAGEPAGPAGAGAAAEPPAGAAGVSGAGEPTAPGDARVVVHVVGQVASPGVVTLPAGSRVGDALEAAGGATGDADLAAVNLARPVVDGEQVYVPAPGEDVPPAAVAPGASGGAAGGDAAGAGGGAPAGPVDLNAADATTLQTLPGIGPVLAERIVAWREEHGPFASVEELGEVSGIGPAILDGLRDAARV